MAHENRDLGPGRYPQIRSDLRDCVLRVLSSVDKVAILWRHKD
jgi:hypothetical protein